MMRTVVLEPAPDDLQRAMLDACREAIQLTLEGMRPGVSGRALAEQASKPINDLPPEIIKDGNRGYSLEAGEITWSAWPGYISERLNETTLEAGHVFHVRAATRRVGHYAATLSETVLVTETGYEVLTGVIPCEVIVK
jgi:Xaa-Pro dipeptidase